MPQIFLRVNDLSSKTHLFSYNKNTDMNDLLQWLTDTFGITQYKYFWMRQGARYIGKEQEDLSKKLVDSIIDEQTLYIEPRFHAIASDPNFRL